MKPPLVLVHGAWGGAWVWRRVLAPLRAGEAIPALMLAGRGIEPGLGVVIGHHFGSSGDPQKPGFRSGV